MPLVGRGGLVFAELGSLALHEHAVAALREIVPEVAVLHHEADVRRWWASLRASGPATVLVHDPLCPLTPAGFLADVLERVDDVTSVVAYRPVTDTVKTARGGLVGATIDRDGLAALASPMVLAPELVAAAGEEPPPLDDAGRLVRWARALGPVELVTAPSIARRVDDFSAVHLLESIEELGRQVRHT